MARSDREQFLGAKKAGGVEHGLPGFEKGKDALDVGLGLAETLDAVARFPLTTLFEQVDALETLQNIALNDEAVGPLETLVL
jgi:hypothetical protein